MVERLTFEDVMKMEDRMPVGHRLAVMGDPGEGVEAIVEGFLHPDWRSYDDGFVRVIDDRHEECRTHGFVRVDPETIDWADFIAPKS